MVFQKIQHEAVAGNLHIEGRRWLVAVFPVKMAAKVVEIKLTRLLH